MRQPMPVCPNLPLKGPGEPFTNDGSGEDQCVSASRPETRCCCGAPPTATARYRHHQQNLPPFRTHSCTTCRYLVHLKLLSHAFNHPFQGKMKRAVQRANVRSQFTRFASLSAAVRRRNAGEPRGQCKRDMHSVASC